MESYEPTDKISLQQWHEQQHQDDDEPPIAPPVDPLDAQTVLAMVQLLCVPDQRGNIIWKAALKRLAVLAHTLLPEVGAKSLDKIADQLTKAGVSCCRASLSNVNVMLYQVTGIRRTEKTDSNRESYRRRACEVWNRRAERNRKTTKKESEIVDSQ